MRLARFYCPIALQNPSTLELPEATFHHAIQVLRLNVGDALVLFNGDGQDYFATLTQVNRRTAQVIIEKTARIERESPFHITLALAIIKPDKMDFALQKATELGVQRIQPLFTERSVIRHFKDKSDKKYQHWQGIVTSACEQSGRTQLPLLLEPLTLPDYIAQPTDYLRLMLEPSATQGWAIDTKPTGVELIIGPEGGFSANELQACQQAGVTTLTLGPRVLRAETACMSALTVVQYTYGDLCKPIKD